jgi:hypothetical protein
MRSAAVFFIRSRAAASKVFADSVVMACLAALGSLAFVCSLRAVFFPPKGDWRVNAQR